ncbi:hypothetical protein DFJ74DRAFT_682850 [Hyaloraphidium curvatum]|nr:hypothetical protein DFJ74DRAFT_682850 [Hyaloraphidium curvatum]
MHAPTTPMDPTPPPQPAADFPHQVAGHSGILLLPDGTLLKPSTGTEAAFYEESRSHGGLASLMPAYHGTVVRPSDGPGGGDKVYVRMDNALARFRRPCVLDVKLGTVLYDASAGEEKREKMRRQAAETTSLATGVRVCGMKVWDPEAGEDVAAERDWCRKLTPEQLPGVLRSFFCLPRSGAFAYRHLIPAVVARLKEVEKAFEGDRASLIASSVLVAYEGDPGGAGTPGAARPGEDVEVKLIDFAHSRFLRPDEVAADEGYLFGLRTLIGMLEAAYAGR